jgi:ectoine hydroxylase-related dioxygenase (phytanoyl-CoA dioxygenase family)
MMCAVDDISDDQIEAFQNDGAVLIPGLFTDWTEKLAAGIERNLNEPGPHAAENLHDGEKGRFFDDYCNWTRISEFTDFVTNSQAADAAARLMKSETVQMFHEHVLVKEAGTSKQTPWHQDSPYYFVDGDQTLSFWVPVDPVKETTLRFVAGSHLWDRPVLPTRWLSDDDFYRADDEYLPVPDPDAEPGKYRILEWPMEPGDAVAFHFKTLHGTRGNHTNNNRRAFSVRFVGEDARYVERPGPTSPPFVGHGMAAGERLREDWFPIIRRG